MKHIAKRLTTLCTVILLAAATTLCRAEDRDAHGCAEGFVDRISLGLGYPSESMSDLPVLVACKVWPTHPGEAIFAMAYPRETSALDGSGTYDLQVLLVEHPSTEANSHHRMPRILARFAQAEAFAVDSIYLSDLTIDTTEWKLAPGVQAFGIRSTMNVRSSVNLYSEDSIRLFRREDARLLPLLDPMVTHRTTGSWDSRCAGEASQLQRTIGIGHQPATGYADVIVTEAVVHTSTSLAQGVCELQEMPRSTARHTLSFTGEGYSFPESWSAP